MDVSYLVQNDHVRSMRNNVGDDKKDFSTRILTEWLCSAIMFIITVIIIIIIMFTMSIQYAFIFIFQLAILKLGMKNTSQKRSFK